MPDSVSRSMPWTVSGRAWERREAVGRPTTWQLPMEALEPMTVSHIPEGSTFSSTLLLKFGYLLLSKLFMTETSLAKCDQLELQYFLFVASKDRD